MLALDNNKQQDCLASSINALDHCYPLAIARLLQLYPTTLFRTCNNYYSWDNAYLKPYLVEVVDVCLLDTVLCDCVPHKRKPTINDLRIFVLGPLVVIFPIEMRSELWVLFNKVVYCHAHGVQGPFQG